MAEKVCWASGQRKAGFASTSAGASFTSPTTPTITGLWSQISTVRPTGSSPGKYLRARASFTTTTYGAPSTSEAVKKRPRFSDRPTPSKKPGLAAPKRAFG